MKRPKCYISGKITGLDEALARENFEFAEHHVHNHGYEVINPFKLPHDHDKSWEAYMLENLAALSKCKCIYFLPNWRSSPGARIEKLWAERLKIIILNPKEVA